MDDDAQDRTRALGEALQTGIAARVIADPGMAGSPFVIGMDALASMMIHSPAALADFSPMLVTVVDLFNYAITGEPLAAYDAILAGEIPGLGD